MNYLGDMTNRVIRVSNSQSIADGHSGADVFMNLTERNGVFRTGVTATNTGSGTIDVGRVVNSTAWVADNYTLQFTSPTDWQVVDDTLPTPVVIATGTGFVERAEHFISRRERDHHGHARHRRQLHDSARAEDRHVRDARRARGHARLRDDVADRQGDVPGADRREHRESRSESLRALRWYAPKSARA